jgi:hypothetical protein
MSRARNIKPGFFTNGDLLECDPLARLLFAGLWCEADRRGILEDRPKTIKVKILPGDSCDIEALLGQLAERGFIGRYEANGVRCIVIPSFDKHQNPHVKEQENGLPLPVEHQTSTVLAPDKNSTNPADSFNLDSLIPESPSLNPDSTSSSLERDEGERARPKPTKTQSRNCRIPPDWEPGAGVIRVAQELHMDEPMMLLELDKFTSHYRANGKTMLDWQQTAMNWLRRSADFTTANVTPFQRGSPSRNGRMTPADHLAAVREAEERESRQALGGNP